MSAEEVIRHELPIISKIVQDETWLLGERRGCPVDPKDLEVQLRVAEIIIQIGKSMRQNVCA